MSTDQVNTSTEDRKRLALEKQIEDLKKKRKRELTSGKNWMKGFVIPPPLTDIELVEKRRIKLCVDSRNRLTELKIRGR